MDRRWIYLALFLVGVIVPMSQFLPWLAANGLNVPLFTHELFATRISSFATLDVLTAFVTVLYMAFTEGGRVRLRWLPVLFTISVGVSAGLPLLLFLREGELRRGKPVI